LTSCKTSLTKTRNQWHRKYQSIYLENIRPKYFKESSKSSESDLQPLALNTIHIVFEYSYSMKIPENTITTKVAPFSLNHLKE